MNGLIIIREVCKAIKKTKTGDVPRPDGLPASYYKCFEDDFLQSLQKYDNFYFIEGKDVEDWEQANIALTLNEGQDLILTRNYWLILLLNNNCKLITIILA